MTQHRFPPERLPDTGDALESDLHSAQVVDAALERMRTGAVVREERHAKGRFMSIAAILITALAVFAGYDFVFQTPKSATQADGSISVMLEQHASGHYFSKGKINDQPVKFLLDTGATQVAIPEAVARRLNLPVGLTFKTRTASGTGTSSQTKIRTLSLGGIVRHDVDAAIAQGMQGDEILLGMSFLRHLKLQQEDGVLTLSE